jgi:integrase
MASIRSTSRKDGSTAHRVFFRHLGKQTCYTFDSLPLAETFKTAVDQLGSERAIAIHRVEREPRGGSAPGITLAAWIKEHLDALSGTEKKTITEYRRYLTRDIGPVLGCIPLTALSRGDISMWVNKMGEAGVSGKTIQNKVGFLSGCLNAAVPKHIPANPAAGIRLPRTIKREMSMLTPPEYELLKSAFTERWHPLLDLLVTSGCRFSEATALTPADIDPVTNTIRITKAWKRVDGDDDGPGSYELGPPKTIRSTRSVSVPASVIDNLDLTHEYVFTNSQGGPIRLYSWRSNVWVPSLAKAKAIKDADTDKPILTKPVRIHDLRHTCASWLLGKGVPLIVVSQHLGHEDVSVTAKVYGHLDRSAGQAAAAAMAAVTGMSNASNIIPRHASALAEIASRG